MQISLKLSMVFYKFVFNVDELWGNSYVRFIRTNANCKHEILNSCSNEVYKLLYSYYIHYRSDVKFIIQFTNVKIASKSGWKLKLKYSLQLHWLWRRMIYFADLKEN